MPAMSPKILPRLELVFRLRRRGESDWRRMGLRTIKTESGQRRECVQPDEAAQIASSCMV